MGRPPPARAAAFGPGPAPIQVDFHYPVEGRIDRDLQFNVDFRGPLGYADPGHSHWHDPINGTYHAVAWQRLAILRDPCEIVIPDTIQRPVRLRLIVHALDDGQRVVFPHEPIVRITGVEIRD